MTRELQFDDGKSRKFWSIELQGTRHTVTFGRIGTAGQQRSKEFSTKEEAKNSCDKLIKQKLSKGYVDGPSKGAPKPKKKPAAVVKQAKKKTTNKATKRVTKKAKKTPARNASQSKRIMQDLFPFGWERVTTQKEWSAYLTEQYERDSQPISSFGKDFSLWYDHDFMESGRSGVKEVGVSTLLEGYSYGRSFIPAAIEAAECHKITKANAAILIYGFGYDRPGAEFTANAQRLGNKINSQAPLTFIGSVPYSTKAVREEKPLDEYTGHAARVLHIAFTPDGKYVVTASDDETLIAWDSQTGRAVAPPLGVDFSVYSYLGFDLAGKRFIVSTTSTTYVWDQFPSQESTCKSIHFTCETVSPDGRFGVTVFQEVADLTTGELIAKQFKSEANKVVCLDDQLILMVTEDKQLVCRNFHTGRNEWSIKTPHEDCEELVISPRGNFAVTWDESTVITWDLKNRSVKAVIECPNNVGCVEFISEQEILAREYSGLVHQFAVRNGKLIRQFKRKGTTYGGDLHLARKGKRLAIVDDDYFFVDVWDYLNGAFICRYEPKVQKSKHPFGVFDSVALSPDGKTLVGGEYSGGVHFVKIGDRKAVPIRTPQMGKPAPRKKK